MNIKKTKKSAARTFLEEVTGGPLTLADLLHAIRVGEEMSQAEFAFRLGVSKSHICDIEKGRKNISPVRAMEFARILKYSEHQFVRLALQDIVNQLELSQPWHVELKASVA
jgi:transcriptional regulator with XRE-family HTH domain